MSQRISAQEQPGSQGYQTSPSSWRSTQLQRLEHTANIGYRARDQPAANTYNIWFSERHWDLRVDIPQPAAAHGQASHHRPAAWNNPQTQSNPGPMPHLDALCVAYATLEETMQMVASVETAAICEAASTKRKLLDKIRASLVEKHEAGMNRAKSKSCESARARAIANTASVQISEADTAKQIRKQDTRVRQLTTILTDEAVQDSQFPNNEHSTGVTWEKYAKNELEDISQTCRPLLLEQIRMYDKIVEDEIDNEVSKRSSKRRNLMSYFWNCLSRGVKQPPPSKVPFKRVKQPGWARTF